MFKQARIIFLLLFLAGCGSSDDLIGFDASVSTGTVPIIERVNPNNGQVGDTITIFGLGFSNAPVLNNITVGGAAVTASAYALLDNPANGEVESLTFDVPEGAATGEDIIFVTVFENTSNAGKKFTVNP